MQQMVNAFSEYARAPEMQISRFSLNQLITEVAGPVPLAGAAHTHPAGSG